VDIKAKIEGIASSLTWRIEHKHGNRDIEITSDPWTRIHTIKIPMAGTDWRDIEYLHELAHAVLAERHHLLSTAYFVVGTKSKDIEALVNPIRTASDWYADHLLMQWAPDEEAAEIREHAEIVRRYAGAEMEMIFGGGLCLAQAIWYLMEKRHTIPRRYRYVTEILLSVDPSIPSLQTKCDLVNALAAPICRQRIVLDVEDDMDVWKIKPAK